MLTRIVLIGLGGAIGSVFRYLLSTSVHQFLKPSFPYGTLAVNALGCFLIGFVFVFLLERFNGQADSLRSLLMIGFLGGFTTFSSFSIETLNLIESGELLSGLLNVLISVVLCLSLTWVGVVLGRLL